MIYSRGLKADKVVTICEATSEGRRILSGV